MNMSSTRAAFCLAISAFVGCQSGPRFASIARLNPFSRKAELIASLDAPKSLAIFPEGGPVQAVYPPDNGGVSAGNMTMASDSRNAPTAGNAEYLMARARAAVRANPPRTHEAIDLYRQALKSAPGNSAAHHELAVLCDNEAERYEGLGNHTAAAQHFGQAEENYLAALNARPTDANLLNSLGYSYYLQKRYIDSERLLQRAFDVDPRHVKAASNLGLLYGRVGDYDQALTWLRRVGSEDQVQARMAELFPNGKPRTNHPFGGRLAAAPGSLRYGSHGSPATTDATQQLLTDMRRVREKEESQRAAHDAQRSAFGADPRPGPPVAGNQVSDSELTRIFAEIDKTTRPTTSPQSDASLPSRPASHAITARTPGRHLGSFDPQLRASYQGSGGINASSVAGTSAPMPPATPHHFDSQTQATPMIPNPPGMAAGGPSFSTTQTHNVQQHSLNGSDAPLPRWEHAPGNTTFAGVPTLPAPSDSETQTAPTNAPIPRQANAARQAQFVGMNAGPGSLFPLSPPPTSNPAPMMPAAWARQSTPAQSPVRQAGTNPFPQFAGPLPGNTTLGLNGFHGQPAGSTSPGGYGVNPPSTAIPNHFPTASPPATNFAGTPHPGLPAAAQPFAGVPPTAWPGSYPGSQQTALPATTPLPTPMHSHHVPGNTLGFAPGIGLNTGMPTAAQSAMTRATDPMAAYEAQLRQHAALYGNPVQGLPAGRTAAPTSSPSPVFGARAPARPAALPRITPGQPNTGTATAVYPE